MTSPQPKVPAPGDQVHFLRSGALIPMPGGSGATSHVTRRGQTITLTDALIEAAQDRHGGPGWLGLVNDPAATWVQPGPAPQGMSPWSPGGPEEAEEREEARKRAWRVEDPLERAAARRAVLDEFGPTATTSRTLNAAPSVAQRPSGKSSR